MKNLLIAGALALACALGACNTSGFDVAGGSLSTSGTTTTVSVDSGSLTTLVVDAQSYAKSFCGIAVAAGDLANLATAGAASGYVALGTLACSAFTGVAYAADDGQAPKRMLRHKRGDRVRGEVIVNGKAIPVQGTVTDPVKVPSAAATPAQ